MEYNFSKDLKSIREILGISQSEFADQIGVEQITISRNELGRTNPSAKILENVYTFSKIFADGFVLPNSFLEIVICSTPIWSANSLWEIPNISRIDFKSFEKLYSILITSNLFITYYLNKFNINLFITHYLNKFWYNTTQSILLSRACLKNILSCSF